MYQRSPTYVMSTKNGLRILLSGASSSFVSAVQRLINRTHRSVLRTRATDRDRRHHTRFIPTASHTPCPSTEDERSGRGGQVSSRFCSLSDHALRNDIVLREILDGLRKRGFKLGWGNEGSGFLLLAWTKGGGYYLGSYFHYPSAKSIQSLRPQLIVCFTTRPTQTSARANL